MSGDYGRCSECGTPLQLGERRMCSPCWVAYWNAQLESVPVERLITREQERQETMERELSLIAHNLHMMVEMQEQTIAQQEQTIRLQQEHIDALSEDLAGQSEYLAFMCDRLSQEEARGDGLLVQNNALAVQLQRYEKRNGHLVR